MYAAKAFSRALLLAATLSALAVSPACANDITTEWASVKPPPVPQLKSATIEPKTTALLVLDFMKENCGVRPRCASTVPVANKLIAAARAHNMMLFFTMVGPTPKPDAMIDGIERPHEGEWVPRGGADKFVGSDLEARLKAHGIKTVLVIGTSAQGAVVGTSNGATQRGYKVVVPVDGIRRRIPITSSTRPGTSTRAARRRWSRT